MIGSLKLEHTHQYVGKRGILPVEGGKLGLVLQCTAVREVYGRFDVQMAAWLNGMTGTIWVSESRIAWQGE